MSSLGGRSDSSHGWCDRAAGGRDLVEAARRVDARPGPGRRSRPNGRRGHGVAALPVPPRRPGRDAARGAAAAWKGPKQSPAAGSRLRLVAAAGDPSAACTCDRRRSERRARRPDQGCAATLVIPAHGSDGGTVDPADERCRVRQRNDDRGGSGLARLGRRRGGARTPAPLRAGSDQLRAIVGGKGSGRSVPGPPSRGRTRSPPLRRRGVPRRDLAPAADEPGAADDRAATEGEDREEGADRVASGHAADARFRPTGAPNSTDDEPAEGRDVLAGGDAADVVFEFFDRRLGQATGVFESAPAR